MTAEIGWETRETSDGLAGGKKKTTLTTLLAELL